MRPDSIIGYVYGVETFCPRCTAALFGWGGEGDAVAYLDRWEDAKASAGIDISRAGEFPKAVLYSHAAGAGIRCADCQEPLVP